MEWTYLKLFPILKLTIFHKEHDESNLSMLENPSSMKIPSFFPSKKNQRPSGRIIRNLHTSSPLRTDSMSSTLTGLPMTRSQLDL